jgi:DNA-binding NarL/FixJ family response regulator
MKPLYLLIVSDDPLARAGLALLFAELPDCRVVGQANSEEISGDFDTSLSHPAPDAIIWDWGWRIPDPLTDGLDMTAPIVALLGDSSLAAEAWNAGIRVILGRDTAGEALLHAARAACQGLIVLDPGLALSPIPHLHLSEDALAEELTPRELQVLQKLSEGHTNKAIGQVLDISEHTVKFHVNAIMSKFGAQNRTEAVVRATRRGLISL